MQALVHFCLINEGVQAGGPCPGPGMAEDAGVHAVGGKRPIMDVMRMSSGLRFSRGGIFLRATTITISSS